jgi:hypothetical protein
MATSGSTDFTLTRDDIITEALEYLDALSTGASVPTADTTSANRTFNMFVKALQLEGVNLWTRTWTQKDLGSPSVVTNGGTDYYCVRSHTSSASTEPGVGSNWTTYWETTNETSGGAWVTATAYNFIGDFTLDATYINVDQAVIREPVNGKNYDYPMTISPFGGYLDVANKVSTTRGVPRKMFLDRQLAAITGYLYPVPEEGMVVHMLAVRTIEDFEDGDPGMNDNPDFPVRWFEALSLGLAAKLAPKYGIWGEKLGQLTVLYEKALSKAKADDKEHVSLFVQPTYTTDEFK